MANKVGPLIKDARTKAGLSQEKLAAKIAGFSAADLSKAERGELIPTNEQLKKIAVATGVTQKSLLDAAKASAPAKKTTTAAKTTTAKTTTAAKKTTTAKTATAAKKTTTAAKKTTTAKTATAAKKTTTAKTAAAAKKTTTAKTTMAKTTTAAKTTAAKKTAAKVPANANTSIKVTTTEKTLINTYREATSNAKKAAMKVLKGEVDEKALSFILNGTEGLVGDGLGDLVSNLLGGVLGGKREGE